MNRTPCIGFIVIEKDLRDERALALRNERLHVRVCLHSGSGLRIWGSDFPIEGQGLRV